MNKDQFERVALGIIIASLLYVPTHVCVYARCIPKDWAFILDTQFSVDFGRLIIQEVIVGLILYYIWKKNYKN